MVVFFQKNLVYQTEKPTLSEINLLYLIIVTTACHTRHHDLSQASTTQNINYLEPPRPKNISARITMSEK